MKPNESLRFSGKQQRTATLLAGGFTVKKTASTVGCTPTTVFAWLQQEQFVKLVAQRQAKIVSRVMGSLIRSGMAASTTLAKCLKSDDGDMVRLRAATAILDQLLRLREAVQLEERVKALEQKMGARHEH